VLVNTSFNVRGEPIVCTPTDAYRCFMRTNIDHLVIGNCLLSKSEQRVVDGQLALAHGAMALD
jgi:carbamoyltransferase